MIICIKFLLPLNIIHDVEKSFEFDNKKYLFKDMKIIIDKIRNQNKGKRFNETIQIVEGKKILDFGCNVGFTSYELAKKNYTVIGIDYQQSQIDIANEFNKLDNISYEVRDIFSNPFQENTFDCILFAETIEHVENPMIYLREFYRILKPGGYLILSTPNATSLKNIFYALSYTQNSKRKKIIEEIYTEKLNTGTHIEHIYNWDFPTITRLIFKSGFKIKNHTFLRSGPIVIPILGKKYVIIKQDSNFLKFLPSLMVHHLIKAQK